MLNYILKAAGAIVIGTVGGIAVCETVTVIRKYKNMRKEYQDMKTSDAIKQAVASPLIETSISGATRMIMCIKGDESLPLAEVSTYVTMVRNLVHENCNIKWSVDLDNKYGDAVEVLIVASGFSPNQGVNHKGVVEIDKTEIQPEPQAEQKNNEKPNGKPPFFGFFKNFKK